MTLNASRNKTKPMKIFDVIIFFLGVFASMPIVCIKIGGQYISCFTILFILVAVVLFVTFICNGSIKKIGKNLRLLILWFLFAICSSLFGYLYFYGKTVWQTAALKYLPKLCLYIIFAFLWHSNPTHKQLNRHLLKGLIYGCVANLVWAIIDGCGFYLFGDSINNLVFKQYAEYAGTRYGTVSLVNDGMIRSGGFNDDPAHIGFIAPVITAYAIYTKKNCLLFVVLGAIICSASTTALLCSFLIVVFNIARLAKNIKQKPIAFCITLTLLCGVLLIPGVFKKVTYAINRFASRIFNSYGNFQTSGERSVYLMNLFQALFNSGISVLFGTGIGTASHAYVFDDVILRQLGSAYQCTPYDIEMNYLTYFFDLGVIGLAVYLMIMYKLYHGVRKDTSYEGRMIHACMVGMILSAFFYHYTLMAMQVLLMIAGSSYLDCKRKAYLREGLMSRKDSEYYKRVKKTIEAGT